MNRREKKKHLDDVVVLFDADKWRRMIFEVIPKLNNVDLPTEQASAIAHLVTPIADEFGNETGLPTSRPFDEDVVLGETIAYSVMWLAASRAYFLTQFSYTEDLNPLRVAQTYRRA